MRHYAEFHQGLHCLPKIGLRSVSDCRYVSDCNIRGHELDPGPVPYLFKEIDHEIISTTILLPSTDSRRVVVSYKRKYVHEVLVNCFVKLAQEKVWLDELTVQT